jgi:hypothetical protein
MNAFDAFWGEISHVNPGHLLAVSGSHARGAPASALPFPARRSPPHAHRRPHRVADARATSHLRVSSGPGHGPTKDKDALREANETLRCEAAPSSDYCPAPLCSAPACTPRLVL